MAAHPDLLAEQAHLDRAVGRLTALRARAEEVLRDALRGEAGGTHQARVEREALVEATLRRLQALQLGAAPLCFGRIDTEVGDAFHIGRVAVADEDQTPLVVDWRAPVAEPFYRATGRHPMGLRRRRHFLVEGQRIEGIEDEDLGEDVGEVDGSAVGVRLGHGLAGSGVLRATLERSRTGHMRDIVATIQREQDEIIRAPLRGVLVVQGGPGTGKTAVALHRAAYLLYSFRFPLERQGVLVLGPNRLFLRYIEQVLPSLGETGVVLSSVGRLAGELEARGDEPAATARLKGDARMATLLRRAVSDRQRALRSDLLLNVDGRRLRLTAAATTEIVRRARRGRDPHNDRRQTVERLVAERLHNALDGSATGTPTQREILTALRRDPDNQRALDRMWPVLTAEELLHDLLGAPALLRLAGRRHLLTDHEQRRLSRDRSPSPDDVPWTPADLPLLDEASALLGSPRKRPTRIGSGGPGGGSGTGASGSNDASTGPRTYGHIVVDEAQDLTPMQLRMVARRSIGSMTLVGDLAQATGDLAPRTWDEVLAHLPSAQEARIEQLTVNYRTPAELMDLAAHVLAAALPEVRPPRSARSTGEHPAFHRAPPGELAHEVARVVEQERGTDRGHPPGTLAILCPPTLVPGVAQALTAAGIDAADARTEGLGDHVTLVPTDLAKGLEFDVIIVVEPTAIVDGETAGRDAAGLRRLYVTLTRATRRLVVVHERPLPEPMARWANSRWASSAGTA